MRKHLALLALAACFHTGAWAATYTFTGNPYGPAGLHNMTGGCGEGSCGNFTAAMAQTGSITTAAPLPANLNHIDILADVTAFSFSDGLTTYASGDARVDLQSATASTDASGQLTFLHVDVMRWQDPGPHVGVNNRVDVLVLGVVSVHNAQCLSVTPRPAPLGDGCDNAGGGQGNASSAEPGPLPAQAAQSVPADNPFALVLTAAGLLGLALRGRRGLLLKR